MAYLKRNSTTPRFDTGSKVWYSGRDWWVVMVHHDGWTGLRSHVYHSKHDPQQPCIFHYPPDSAFVLVQQCSLIPAKDLDKMVMQPRPF